MITFVLNETDARLLEQELEDVIEFLMPMPDMDEDGGIDADELFEFVNKSATSIEFMSQRMPMLALTLSMLYDAEGWPGAVDRERTMKLINEAVEEARNEPDEELGS